MAPSGLGSSNHQVKQEIHSHNDTEVPLDAITQANARGITQSHFRFAIKSKRDEWEGVCSAHKDLKNVKSLREMPWSRLPSIYRAPQK